MRFVLQDDAPDAKGRSWTPSLEAKKIGILFFFQSWLLGFFFLKKKIVFLAILAYGVFLAILAYGVLLLFIFSCNLGLWGFSFIYFSLQSWLMGVLLFMLAS